MIERDLSAALMAQASLYPVVFLTGPRQSGKTTLARHVFAHYSYVSLEDPDNRLFALNDPRGFIKTYPCHTIIDEAQRVPELFSYLQTHVDETNEVGSYILTGSQNFLMMQGISQSLAGRVGILRLLPLSYRELARANRAPARTNEWLFASGYPRIYDKGIPPANFYDNYTQTYLERDVRQIKNITDLNAFLRFVRLCAGRTGQALNMSELANAGAISVPTVRSWLSILEASYLVYLLVPYHRNFNKRLTKTPKLYFYDTGLACSLLGIQSAEQLDLHYLRGSLFENMVINEYLKSAYAHASIPQISYWRDNNATEVDLLVEEGLALRGFEIKASATMNSRYFKNLNRFETYAQGLLTSKTIVFDGDEIRHTSEGTYLPWRQFPTDDVIAGP
jgi:predicted AAA+ superfamily ATPase